MTDKDVKRFWSRVLKLPGRDACWLFTVLTGKKRHAVKRYGTFTLSDGTKIQAHRFALELTSGPLAPGLLGCHHCDNPPCVRPSHLFPGTTSDNLKDAIKKGRWSPIKKPLLLRLEPQPAAPVAPPREHRWPTMARMGLGVVLVPPTRQASIDHGMPGGKR